MIFTAAILLTIIFCLAILSITSFSAAVFGALTKREGLRNISFGLFVVFIFLFTITTTYAGGRAMLRIYSIGQNLWRQTNEKVAGVNRTIDEILHPTTQSMFRQITGYEWPEEAEVISTRDTYLIVEGEYEITFTASPETLQNWLANAPPWGEAWRTGPTLPTEERLKGQLSSSPAGEENVWYAVHELCCDGLAWHNGSIFVIDLNTNTVWLKIWDY